MCCFSGDVVEVAATKIFAGDTADGRQLLIYEMEAAFDAPVAMVLPLPVPPDGPDDAVKFLDLSANAELFVTLEREFPVAFGAIEELELSRGVDDAAERLVVHQVGAFEASFVPRSADFARLDPRFRLGPDVLDALPQYADWGFAVFQLSADPGGRSRFHPMGLVFPRRDRDALFFPTAHVHDGVVHPTAAFDHRLYAQVSPAVAAHLDWERSDRPLGHTDLDCAAIGFDPDRPAFATTLEGDRANVDAWLRSPRFDVPEVRGAGYEARLRMPALVRVLPGDPPPADEQWRGVADALVRTLQDDLPAIVAEHGDGSLTDGRLRFDWWQLHDDAELPCAVRFGFVLAPAGDVQLEVIVAVGRGTDRGVARQIQRDLMRGLGPRWSEDSPG